MKMKIYSKSDDVIVHWNPQYYGCYTIVPPNVTGGVLGFSVILYIDYFPPEPRKNSSDSTLSWPWLLEYD